MAVLEDTVSRMVTIKYGPNDDESFELELNDGETRESLMARGQEKINAIKELQAEIDAIKNGGEGPNKKKAKTERDDVGDIQEKPTKQEC